MLADAALAALCYLDVRYFYYSAFALEQTTELVFDFFARMGIS